MAEERKCYNCAIDLICQECNEDDSKWQPISKSKVQHTKEEWASIIDDLDWNPDVMVELEQKGYIRKTAVEEAEDYEKHFARIMDLGLSCTIKDLEYSMRIIERLKSEIERLKK